MNTSRLVTIITFLAVFAMAARVSVDNDTWWHLRAGQWILENRAVPQVDPFSYTRAGDKWQYPGWLVEVPMYLIYRDLGPGGLNLWTAAMVTLTFIFLWGALSGGSFLKAFVTVLAAATSGIYWAARPYLATFLLAAVYLCVLEDFRWRRSSAAERRLWWLPVWMVLWANSHGGFAVGFILWGIYWIDGVISWFMDGSITSRMRSVIRDPRLVIREGDYRLSIVGLLMILAVCVNPSGPVMLAYSFKTVSIGTLKDYIQEWQSPDFHLLSTQPFIWLLISTFAAVGASRRRLALTDFLLVGGFTYMGLLAGRNMALFALAAPPVLTRHAAPVFVVLGRKLGFRGASTAAPNRSQAVLNWALLGILVLAVIVKAGMDFPRLTNEEKFTAKFPVDAVAIIKAERPPGRMFNSYNWGAYLLWELPEYPVFVDGRTDLYNDELLDQWFQVVRAEEGWQQVLYDWEVRLIVLEPTLPVVGYLEVEGWRLLYGDEVAVVYTR